MNARNVLIMVVLVGYVVIAGLAGSFVNKTIQYATQQSHQIS